MTHFNVRSLLNGWAPPAIETRGEEYFVDGRVTLVNCSSREIEARVRGTQSYLVSWELAEDGALTDCDCPYASDGACCKHIFATALQIEADPQAADFRLSLRTLARQPSNRLNPPTTPERGRLEEEMQHAVFPGADGWEQRYAERHEEWRWQRLSQSSPHPAEQWLNGTTSQTWYLLDQTTNSMHGSAVDGGPLALLLAQRTQNKRGEWSRATKVGKLPQGPRPKGGQGLVLSLARSNHEGVALLDTELVSELLPELCNLGLVGYPETVSRSQVRTLRWDAEPSWRLILISKAQPGDKTQVTIQGHLERELNAKTESLKLSEIEAFLPHGLLIHGDRILRAESGQEAWLTELRTRPLFLKKKELKALERRLAAAPSGPRFAEEPSTLPGKTQIPLEALLQLQLPQKSARLVRGTLTFRYGKHVVGAETTELSKLTNQAKKQPVLIREFDKEAALVKKLQELDIHVSLGALESDNQPFVVKFEGEEFPRLAPSLVTAGFIVKVEGKPYRSAKAWQPFVSSGQDWFELHGTLDFDGQEVSLPELLRTIRKKQHWIRLKDGSMGLLPSSWLENLQGLAELAAPRLKKLRFHASQAALVEGALNGAAELQTDAGFVAMKQRFEQFQRIRPKQKPRGFKGTLRDYQRIALGWLQALDDLGFGGCLADDMGLGKTIVVLAWLGHRQAQQKDTQRNKREREADTQPKGPSLIVVPTSLLFNWKNEAQRFTPKLRLLVHVGAQRDAPGAHFQDYDLILTSYGTLRRDVVTLQAIEFDYVVLDEAHNIKNSATASHKAAASLNSRRRLALTGTPIENHLGELWSLLTYLNPGIFQGLSHLQRLFERQGNAPSGVERALLRTLGPFILRRTKAQVAKDLPERIEKTLHVELSKPERKLYDELATYYRTRMLERKLAAKLDKKRGAGARQTTDALEALLRLRQAACHPALISQQHEGASSAKFEALLDKLGPLREQGHKVLIFSQFTKLLDLLKPRLDAAGFSYAYLDGKTKHREAEVERFQTDPSLDAFLISLKAGGVGLNLVAAEYVFLLDPWWNPASEAQAIDRAHRIGQKRTVFAYRLLCAGTVEEKVAALQDEKRELAQAVFNDSGSFSAKFTREDLEQLLS